MFTNGDRLLVTDFYFRRSINTKLLFYFQPGAHLYVFVLQQFQLVTQRKSRISKYITFLAEFAPSRTG